MALYTRCSQAPGHLVVGASSRTHPPRRVHDVLELYRILSPRSLTMHTCTMISGPEAVESHEVFQGYPNPLRLQSFSEANGLPGVRIARPFSAADLIAVLS